jgi:hypothetical protein
MRFSLVFQGSCLSAHELVDFSPVYRGLHIYTVLVSEISSFDTVNQFLLKTRVGVFYQI